MALENVDKSKEPVKVPEYVHTEDHYIATCNEGHEAKYRYSQKIS